MANIGPGLGLEFSSPIEMIGAPLLVIPERQLLLSSLIFYTNPLYS